MSDIDITGSFDAEPTVTGQLETTLVIQGNVDSQFPAQVSVDSVITGDPGSDASVVNVGTPGNARLKFSIPRGDVGPQGATGPQGDQGPQGIQGDQGEKGDTGDTGAAGPANSLSIGTVVDGVTADATITGTAPSQTLNLTLPKGDKGDKGDQGDPGADGVVQSLVAGSNITIDATDPANPIINSTASGSGDVVGPASAVDGTPAVFDGTTGKLIKNITYAAFKTLLSLVKGDVGLGNVDNTSDATKNAAAVALTNKDLTSGTNTFPTLNQNTTGSAAKLTTARTIDGQSFDGTANITVIAPGTHAATSKTTPVDADEFAIVDSAASNVLKKLTWANLKAGLAAFVGDSGSGGTKGVVPAPAAGDAAAGKFLKADGTWAAPSGGGGSGDVIGPASNNDSYVPQWNGANSKTLKDGLAVGTGANNLVQLDGSGKLPAVDGSALTNISASIPGGSSVGAYVWCWKTNYTSLSLGSTIAGSNLATISSPGGIIGSALPGTWMCQGAVDGSNSQTLYKRIA